MRWPISPSLPITIESVLSGETYDIATLTSGVLYYTDRSYTVTDFPAALEGKSFIRTANDDKTRTDSAFLNLLISNDMVAYVGYSDQASALPTWLSTWSNTTQKITTSDSGCDLFLYSKPYRLI